ncbi:hypothetical protein [Nakamurella leprariae]|uniref:Uncharacterized protein n=1 Tax=Nakamurella leprariae TaxID=2803911 RepID=A0A938YA20_9ACTN|nr:hypothetical protein [Nakamurella leprariae]MBM9466742.1 hypothetical protein [Nakamurella leprariae]
MDATHRIDVEQAMGVQSGDCLWPPVPFDDASPYECCEAVWSALGQAVTPAMLASLDDQDVTRLAAAVGQWFEVDTPSLAQVRTAGAQTLARWPA